MISRLRHRRRAILQRVSDESGETCNLTMVDGIDVVYVDRVESQLPLRVELKPGSRVPLHCSASGVGIDNEEFLTGLLCVAAPVVVTAGRHVATIALQAPSARLSLDRAMDCVPMMRQAAEAMARTFAPRTA